jgi:hypothetical protein
MEFVDNNKGRLRGAMPSTMARALAACVLFLSIPYAQAAVDTFQEGVSSYSGTQDTFLEQNTPDTSHDESLVKVENDAPQVQHGLIRFDNIFGNGAGQIPYGSIINSASLTVEVDNVSSAGAQIRLHRMLVTWPESATWNSMVGTRCTGRGSRQHGPAGNHRIGRCFASLVLRSCESWLGVHQQQRRRLGHRLFRSRHDRASSIAHGRLVAGDMSGR